MSSILNTLNIGYSGLNAAQVGINTTGHNIANAEVDQYTRQRVVQSAQTPLFTRAGNIGSGTKVQDIARIFDNFVFDRYTSISSDKEYSDFSKQSLQELSTYFPEIDGVGIKADLAEYYNMWQTFADNSGNDAMKIALTKQTQTLTEHINQVQSQVKSLQSSLNNQLSSNINEVNSLASQLADLNGSIDTAESGDVHIASDLRDQRNLLEHSLARLIGSKVKQKKLQSNIQIDSNANTRTGSYTLSVNGFNLVDGKTFHPLHITNKNNPNSFYSVSYERQDGVLIPMEETLNSGKIGAIFALRGGVINETTGTPTDGIVQKVTAQLDAFAKGLIESTNNLYAASASTAMQSNPQTLDTTDALVNSNLNIHEGSFDFVIYNIDGDEVARRSINIDSATSIGGVAGSNSVEAQVKANVDDNSDGNANNDIDNFLSFNYQRSSDGVTRLELEIKPSPASQGYTFSLEDKLKTADFSSGTNFAGALGLKRYLDGDNASNINLCTSIANNPISLHAGYSVSAGDSRVALNMVQQQFEKYDFSIGQEGYNTTTYGMFDIISTFVGISTNAAITKNDTTTTQFNAVELEYNTISKVNVDEELTNLIKYQTSYGASAKVITAIDKMMQTLLGIN